MNGAQLIIHKLTKPSSTIWYPDGPDQFPRKQEELRGPITTHRYLVWRDALGTDIYDEDAGLAALNLTDEESVTVKSQCAFIREHTKPIPPMLLTENPFLNNDWDFRTGPTKRSQPFTITDEQLQQGWTSALGSFTLPDFVAIKEFLDTLPVPEDPHDQRRRPGEVPRPKRTPPMWAHNPTKTRRDRKATRRVK